MIKGRLDTRASALLRWTAAVFDGFVVYIIAVTTAPVWQDLQSAVFRGIGVSPSSHPNLALHSIFAGLWSLSIFLLLLLLYWLAFEVLLGGRTPGRACLGLEMRRADGAEVKAPQRVMRGTEKLLSFGLRNLSLRREDACDRRYGLVWWSPMAPGAASAMRNWRLSIDSGPYKGHASDLERLDGFNLRRQIRIGRDATWSDIPLDRDANVSRQHLIIRLRAGVWEAQDFGGGRGSTHGTSVNGKRLAPVTWSRITLPAEFSLAGTRLSLRKN